MADHFMRADEIIGRPACPVYLAMKRGVLRPVTVDPGADTETAECVKEWLFNG